MAHIVKEPSLKTGSTPMILLRAGASALWDRLLQPVARDQGDIPWSVNAITKEWLDHVLVPQESAPLIANLTIERHSSGTSVRGRLLVEYTETGSNYDLPESFFCKSTPSIVTRIANGVSNTMTYEGGFYGLIRPELSLEAPLGYFSDCDVRTLRSIHLLEDLVETKGATFCSADSVISLDEANNVVEVLAALHSRFWQTGELPSKFPWVPSFKAWNERGAEVINLEQAHNEALDDAYNEGILPEGFAQNRELAWTRFKQSLDLNASLPATLLHGDVHLGNWYKTNSGAMGLCDWQCISRGHWGRDLAYALSTTVSVENRRNWERELVTHYCEVMSEKSGTNVDFHDAWLRYRQHLPTALLMWTPTLKSPRFMPDMQPRELALEMVHRIATAIDDLDAMESLV